MTDDLNAIRQRHERLWNRYVELFCAKRFDEWSQLWHPDGSFTVAYPVDGFPATTTGRQALHTAFDGLANAVGTIAITDTVLDQTTDPRVAFAGYRIHVDLRSGGSYDNTILSRLTIEDGLVRQLVEYYDRPRYESLLDAVGAR